MRVVKKPKLIIAALSSRAYVKAAVQAGFEVVAIDIFCDMDTQKIAHQTHQVALSENGFDAKQLLTTLASLDLSTFTGFCYGAGFEAQPELLTAIAKYLPVFGNNEEAVRHVKNPQMFQALCHAFEMATPPTLFKRPRSSIGWLSKVVGASGGWHIKALLPLELSPNKVLYYQQIVLGTPISCLFLADGIHAEVIGFSEQWCAPSMLHPYRYGGAVSHAEVSAPCKLQIEAFIRAMTYKLTLRGINSADFIVDGNRVYALEINPRLSATLDLYSAKRGDFFVAHIAACQAQLTDWPKVKNTSRAHHIIYTSKIAHVPSDMDWPEWVSDIPQPNTILAADLPLCTVIAEAHTARLAKQKVLERAADL